MISYFFELQYFSISITDYYSMLDNIVELVVALMRVSHHLVLNLLNHFHNKQFFLFQLVSERVTLSY